MFYVTSRVVANCMPGVMMHAVWRAARSVAWELSRIDVAFHLRSRTQGTAGLVTAEHWAHADSYV